jgi:hypothetical protein
MIKRYCLLFSLCLITSAKSKQRKTRFNIVRGDVVRESKKGLFGKKSLDREGSIDVTDYFSIHDPESSQQIGVDVKISPVSNSGIGKVPSGVIYCGYILSVGVAAFFAIKHGIPDGDSNKHSALAIMSAIGGVVGWYVARMNVHAIEEIKSIKHDKCDVETTLTDIETGQVNIQKMSVAGRDTSEILSRINRVLKPALSKLHVKVDKFKKDKAVADAVAMKASEEARMQAELLAVELKAKAEAEARIAEEARKRAEEEEAKRKAEILAAAMQARAEAEARVAEELKKRVEEESRKKVEEEMKKQSSELTEDEKKEALIKFEEKKAQVQTVDVSVQTDPVTADASAQTDE